MTDPLLTGDRFVVDQLIRPMVNLYQVSTADETGTAVEPVAFVRQARLKLREEIVFHADESQTRELFRFKARRAFDLGGRYDITEPSGATIGVLENRFRQSLLRSTWAVLDPGSEEERLLVQERSMPIAIVRRLWGFLPLEVPFLFPYHFDLLEDGGVVGSVERQRSLRDRYLLDLHDLPPERLDRRVAVALAIALDALQSR